MPKFFVALRVEWTVVIQYTVAGCGWQWMDRIWILLTDLRWTLLWYFHIQATIIDRLSEIIHPR